MVQDTQEVPLCVYTCILRRFRTLSRHSTVVSTGIRVSVEVARQDSFDLLSLDEPREKPGGL